MLQISAFWFAIFNIFHKIMKVIYFLLHFFLYWYKIYHYQRIKALNKRKIPYFIRAADQSPTA